MKLHDQLKELGTTMYIILFLPIIWLCDKFLPHGDSITEEEADSVYVPPGKDTDEKL